MFSFDFFPNLNFQVVLWVSWFSILGFLHLISQLCRERFEYVSNKQQQPNQICQFIDNAYQLARLHHMSYHINRLCTVPHNTRLVSLRSAHSAPYNWIPFSGSSRRAIIMPLMAITCFSLAHPHSIDLNRTEFDILWIVCAVHRPTALRVMA